MNGIKNIIVQASWKLLEQKGIEGVTIEQLGMLTLLPEITIRKLCPTPLSIFLLMYGEIISTVPPVTMEGLNSHDILFETIMSYLDALAPHKSAIQRFIGDLSISPCWLWDLKPYAGEWSRQKLHEAKIDTRGIIGYIRIHVFNLFCLYVLRLWAYDNTPDQDLTLTTIDQGLKKLEDWQEMMNIC